MSTSPINSICKVCLQPLPKFLTQTYIYNDLCSDKCMNIYLNSIKILPRIKSPSFKAEKIDKETQTDVGLTTIQEFGNFNYPTLPPKKYVNQLKKAYTGEE